MAGHSGALRSAGRRTAGPGGHSASTSAGATNFPFFRNFVAWLAVADPASEGDATREERALIAPPPITGHAGGCFPPRDRSVELKSTQAWRQSASQVANLGWLELS